MVRFNNKKNIYNTSAQIALLTTILYSDIFSFPLTRDELWDFLISERKVTKADFTKGLQTIQKEIVYKDGYYCLKNREAIIKKRKENFVEVEKKMKRARFVARKLAAIPSIFFIGISGGLASGNVSANDDIDLVIITKKNTLFVSRFLIVLLLQLQGARRFRNQKNVADTICVNLLFDETALGFFADKQDIYTAREIAQIIPLFEREDMYRRFFNANDWIYKFLPNVVSQKTQQIREDSEIFLLFLCHIMNNTFFEIMLRTVQIAWMSRHQTKEIVKKHVLAFHPNDYRIKTNGKLRLKMQQLGLLTKF